MADSTTPPRTHTELAERRGPVGHTKRDPGTDRSSGTGMISVVTGGLGIAIGLVPRAGAVALILAVIALATGVPSLRRGTDAPGYSTARIGVVLGLIALVVGILNLGIQMELFTYFTTAD